MDELSKLGIKYGTDKGTKHHYLPVYFEMFRGRENKVKKVVEVGVGEGAGLFMFRDFFPNATIYGADIDQDRVNYLLGEERNRIKVLECDQSFEVDLARLVAHTGPDIDLVIDDGSHLPQDQLFTCLTLMPMLNKEVIYVIEDVADISLAEKIIEYPVEVVECGRRYDDRLVIVRHKNA